MWPLLVIIGLSMGGLEAILFNTYTGKPATWNQLQTFKARNNTRYCVINVPPCNPFEWRRVDGSCNNLYYPSRGMSRTPTIKMLREDFLPNYEPRLAKDGSRLPLSRDLSLELMKDGKQNDMSLTQLFSYYMVFALNDIMSFHDTLNYAVNTTKCCCDRYRNYICTPKKIPSYDPIHRFSGSRCQNLTRPLSFQYFGCADFGSTPFTRMVYATPVYDLSHVYGNDFKIGAIRELRTFKGGLLRVEVEDGQVFPPRNPDLNPLKNRCFMNELPKETRCNQYQSNAVLGATLFSILHYRLHNRIARKLAQINPCWTDQKLFFTARDINIAVFQQIYYYELLPIALGRENLIADKVLCAVGGFRDLYNKNVPPMLYEEYPYAKRYFHTSQDPEVKLYDKDLYYLRSYPMVNLTARTGFLAMDGHMTQILQGSFMQLNGAFDYTIDFDLGERALGPNQFASDVAASDLSKGRYYGFQPYVKYREYCAKKPYKTFNCLKDVMDEERIYRLQQQYRNVEDVDLMAGIWAEKLIPGGVVPYTAYCLMKEQLKRNLVSDRHWFERPNRPHAFTLKQLQAIRKVTIAGVMCTAGDGVTKIQPSAFYRVSAVNPLTPCNDRSIGTINLAPWRDPTCKRA